MRAPEGTIPGAPLVYILSAPGRDEAVAEKLRVALQPAVLNGLIRLVVNGDAHPGDTVTLARGKKMLEATIVVALLSPDFLFMKQELMAPGLGSKALLVPVRIRPCLLIDPDLAACAILPSNGSVCDNPSAVASVATDLFNTVQRLGPGRKPEAPSTHDIHEAVCDLGLFTKRTALLSGIPRTTVASLPSEQGSLSALMLSDINELQLMPEHWAVWLKNACTLSPLQPKSLVFHRALMAL